MDPVRFDPLAPPIIHQPQLQRFIRSIYDPGTIRDLRQLLEEQGTLRFSALENGLFRAAVGVDESTGYQNVWVRDTVHIAHAHLIGGQVDAATRAADTLLTYFRNHRHRFDRVIDGLDDHQDPMFRPHIRFDGVALKEIDQKWAHAQNDALGYFLWLYSLLASRGCLIPSNDDLEMLGAFVMLLQRIEYWHDADSGHWEEVRKIAASSIGTAVAGLRGVAEYLDSSDRWSQFRYMGVAIDRAQVERLVQHGMESLLAILPHECRDPEPERNRRYDSALLFLIYPLRVISGELADRILDDVQSNLAGPYGIRRYLGDSYWCADYKSALSQEDRTADYSDSLAERDAFLRPGMEAQWCIFDPIISVIYAERFLRSGLPADRDQHVRSLNRSLGQITGDDCPFGPFRCPESYYSEAGKYGPNDVTPLLWTQANLWMALLAAEDVARRS